VSRTLLSTNLTREQVSTVFLFILDELELRELGRVSVQI